MVGMTSGKIDDVQPQDDGCEGKHIDPADSRVEAWTRHTGGPVLTRPLPAGSSRPSVRRTARADVVESGDGDSAVPNPDRRPDRRGTGSVWDSTAADSLGR